MSARQWHLVEAAQVAGRKAWTAYWDGDEVGAKFQVALDIALAAAAYRVDELVRRELAVALGEGNLDV